MTPSRPLAVLAATAAVPLAALALAGCGGGDDGTSSSAAAAKAPSGKATTIGVAGTDLGKVLVDSTGRTIYLFEKDSGSKSACHGDCLVDWPPVRTAGKPTVGSGLSASKVGTTPTDGGDPQVTYNGHPLYLFQGDKNPGDTSGQGLSAFGASWFTLSRAGDAITGKSSSGGSSGNGY